MLKRIMASWLCFCVCSTGFSLYAADRAGGSTTRQLIIRLKESGIRRVQAAQQDGTVADIVLPDGSPLRFIRPFNGDGMVVQLPHEVSLEQAQQIANQLAENPTVASVQPDKRMYPALVPNDPQFPNQWHLFEDAAGIRAQAAWDRTTGSSSVVIAQLDTGIIAHRDLNPVRILAGYDFISDPFTANDGDARDADATDPGDAQALGECAGDPAQNDSSWHGLSVAGVMVAESDNLTDIAGVDFAARLLPVRVLGKCGGDLSDVAEAIRWAAGLPVAGVPVNPAPASVINLSLSGEGVCSPEEQAAIDAAVAAGSVVVVAAGNGSSDVANQSPANCANVVTVGAVARDGARASYMNVGEEVDLSAPGGDGGDGILTLFNNGTTVPTTDTLASIQGTSFTTAQVSAVAALMLAVNGALTPAMIEDILRLTTRSFPDTSCNTSLCGQGILDADAALAAAVDPVSVLGAAANNSPGSSGGGGCALVKVSRPDPLLVFLLLVAGIGVRVRHRTI